jgi:hypothetical protein
VVFGERINIFAVRVADAETQRLENEWADWGQGP